MKTRDRIRARGQPPDAVGQRADRRVDDRRSGEVGREMRDRRAVQPMRPFQMPGPQIGGLILERRVGLDEPERKGRLNDEHGDQRPPAGGVPPEHPPLGTRACRRSCGRYSSVGRVPEASVAWRVVVPCSIGRTCLRSGAYAGVTRLPPGSPPAVLTASLAVAISPRTGIPHTRRYCPIRLNEGRLLNLLSAGHYAVIRAED